MRRAAITRSRTWDRRLPVRLRPSAAGSPILRRAARHRLGAWVLALVVAVAVHHVVAEAEARSRAWGRTVEVVTATADVPAGAPLDGRLTVRRLPAVALPEAAVTRPPTGRRAARDVPAGAVLTPADLGGTDAGPVAARLGSGRAAVRVPIEQAPDLATGDRVDVVAPGLDPLTGSAVDARVLARAARVLDLADDGATLAVAAEDAPAVAAVALAGPLALVVRP